MCQQMRNAESVYEYVKPLYKITIYMHTKIKYI